MDTIRIRKDGFPVRLTYNQFYKKYGFLKFNTTKEFESFENDWSKICENPVEYFVDNVK